MSVSRHKNSVGDGFDIFLVLPSNPRQRAQRIGIRPLLLSFAFARFLFAPRFEFAIESVFAFANNEIARLDIDAMVRIPRRLWTRTFVDR